MDGGSVTCARIPGKMKRRFVELDSHEEVRLLLAGPGEVKRRLVSWTPTKILDFHLRDQEEGDELDFHLRVQPTSRVGRWCWTLNRARRDQEQGRWSWALKV